jgi:hypothetical protein
MPTLSFLLLILLLSVPALGQEPPVDDCSKVQLQEKLNYYSNQIGPQFMDKENDFHQLEQDFKNFWGKCEKKMGEKAWNCFDNVQGFFTRHYGVGTNYGRLGLSISDAEYIQKISEKKSEMFQLPQNFFKDNKLPKDWRDRIDSCIRYYSALECKKILAWKYLEFENFCSTKGSPNLKQVIFYFPEDKFDQWVLFRWDTPMQKSGNSLPAQIIAVEKNKNPKDESNVFFGELSSYGLESGVNVSCLKCHTNGPLTIIPMYGSIKGDDPLDLIKEFNSTIAKYGRLNVPYLEEKHRGPLLGQSVGCTECHSSSKEVQSSRSPFQFMSPSIRDALLVRNDHPGHVAEKSLAWRTALDKAYDLSSKNLKEFRALFGGANCTTKAALNTNKGIQDALRFLRVKDEITEEEYVKAKASVLESHSHGNSVYQSFEVEAVAAYKLWLKGGRENCISADPASKVDSPKAK